MIQKILGNFTATDCEQIFAFTDSCVNLLFFGGQMFIAGDEAQQLNFIIEQIRKVMQNNVCVTAINELNLQQEATQVQEWCKNQFIEQDTRRFEQDKQEELQAMKQFIIDLEQALKVLDSEGGDVECHKNKKPPKKMKLFSRKQP